MDIHLGSQLPAYPSFVAGIRRAPVAVIPLRLHKLKRH